MAFAAAIPYIMAGSAAISAIGAIRQGQAAKAAADYNATINQQNALIARQDASQQAAQADRENRLRLGTIRANAGASGGTGAGSVFDVLGDAAAQGELEKQNILYQGELKARGYTNTSNLDTMSGGVAQQAGYMKAGSDLLSGTADAYTAQQKLKRN
jgi:hypothetical protein